MGQYYLVLNLDRKEYLHPHRFGDGLKLLEFGSSSDGTMLGLAVLLAEGNGRGGGDLRSDHPVIGSWARGRVVVAGDYADPEPGGGPDGTTATLYSLAMDENGGWKDVSHAVMEAIADDAYVAQSLEERLRWTWDRVPESLREKIGRAKEQDWGDCPLHVRFARLVLQAPDDVALWRAMLDACLDYAANNPVVKGE